MLSAGYNYSAGERFDLINVLERQDQIQLVFIREKTNYKRVVTLPRDTARLLAEMILA